MAKSFEMDMTKGALFKKIVLYALPLLATNLLQLLFNAADVAIVGHATNGVDTEIAVAAVSSTTSLVNLIIGLFIGLSVGANVILARTIGENDMDKARKIVSTSILISLIVGVALIGICVPLSKTFLQLLNCDEAVLPLATKYLQIYFAGLPIILLYNFSSAILRAVGDTKRPLIYLMIAGVMNVGLNALLVFVFKLDVEGVAIATVVSQGISVVLAITALIKSDGYAKLDLKNLKIYKKELIEVLQIGIPSGVQSCVFAISNVLIQADINSFGQTAMTANGVSSQVDGFIYNSMTAIAHTTSVFVSQNYGAQKLDRIKKTIIYCVICTTVLGVITAIIALSLSDPLMTLLGAKNLETREIAKLRMTILGLSYFTCGIMDVFALGLRGLGKSTSSMVISIFFCCGVRVLWLKTIVANVWHTMAAIYIIYPITWVLASLTFLVMLIYTYKKLKIKFAENQKLLK